MSISIKDNLMNSQMKTNDIWLRIVMLLTALIMTVTTWARVSDTFTVDYVMYQVTSESPKEVTVYLVDPDYSNANLIIPETVSKPEEDDAEHLC